MLRIFIYSLIALGSLCLAMLITGKAHAASVPDRCHDMAAMYRLTYQMRDLGLSDERLITHTRIYGGFSDFERYQAVIRVKQAGDLGYLSGDALYKHIYLECAGVRK